MQIALKLLPVSQCPRDFQELQLSKIKWDLSEIPFL